MNTTVLFYGLLAIILFCGLGACATLSQTYREGKRIRASQEASLPRIEKAANLLLNSHYSIEDIAVELGYPSAEAFSKDFTDWKAMPPEEFRAKIAEVNRSDEKGQL